MSMIYVLWSFTFWYIFIVYTKFFMFPLFYLYIVKNDDNKDDQSINQSLKFIHISKRGPWGLFW